MYYDWMSPYRCVHGGLCTVLVLSGVQVCRNGFRKLKVLGVLCRYYLDGVIVKVLSPIKRFLTLKRLNAAEPQFHYYFHSLFTTLMMMISIFWLSDILVDKKVLLHLVLLVWTFNQSVLIFNTISLYAHLASKLKSLGKTQLMLWDIQGNHL